MVSYEDRFKESILNGVAGTAMPGWKNVLSEKEIDRLIQFIEDRSLEKAPPNFVRVQASLPAPGDPERKDYKGKGTLLVPGDAEKGYVAFQKNCASCHGKLANGKGPNAYALEHPLPRNLINKEFLNQASVSDERLYQSILLGVAGAPMPSHDHLKDQTILDLIAFIRSNTKDAE